MIGDIFGLSNHLDQILAHVKPEDKYHGGSKSFLKNKRAQLKKNRKRKLKRKR